VEVGHITPTAAVTNLIVAHLLRIIIGIDFTYMLSDRVFLYGMHERVTEQRGDVALPLTCQKLRGRAESTEKLINSPLQGS
jgi:hypothetical protein